MTFCLHHDEVVCGNRRTGECFAISTLASPAGIWSQQWPRLASGYAAESLPVTIRRVFNLFKETPAIR